MAQDSSVVAGAEAQTAKPAQPLRALPLVERNATNVISRLDGVRDQIYDWFVAACAAEGVEAMILKSHPFSPTVWVSYESWAPHPRGGDLRERSSAVLTLRGREFHQYECEIDIELKRGNATKKYRSVVAFSEAEARAIVRYSLHRADTIAFKRYRSHPLELWLPANKLTGLRPDLRAYGPTALLVLCVLSFYTRHPTFAVLCLAGAGVWAYVDRFRRVYVISTGKPAQEPRRLVRLDSWQTLVTDLGKEAAAVKEALRAALAPIQQEGARFADERIWYRGVDGKEEREQFVIVFRRAIAFLQVYPYGRDLYVGWDAHVNCGTWIEKPAGRGSDPTTGEPCQYTTIRSGWNVPNEYDITDTNCLIEWVHSATTRVIKRMLAEHRIDQEIDFHILRGERQGIAGRREPADGEDAASRLIRRFKREA